MAKTIMIVDDSSTMLLSLRNSLEIAGFNVLESNDGSVALKTLQGGAKPDLIITDINMPIMGGIEFISKARAVRATQGKDALLKLELF
jgi:two-component system chemotaxis response regulator CheY